MRRHVVLFKWREADYQAYQAHPDHLRVVETAIRPAISARAGAQY